jgi:hypothetical protein
MRWRASGPEFELSGGSAALDQVVAIPAWYAVQAIPNATVEIYTNGTYSTVGGGGSSALTDTINVLMPTFLGEIGVWPSRFLTATATAMTSNQRAYWGF